MKKILVLLITATMVSSAFAQYGNQRDAVFNNGRYEHERNNNRNSNYYSFSARERDMQIDQINREYDRKEREVRNRLFVSRSKKEKLMWELQEQRRNEIRNVYAKFNDRRNRYDDNDHKRHF